MAELPRVKDENGDVWPLIPHNHPQIAELKKQLAILGHNYTEKDRELTSLRANVDVEIARVDNELRTRAMKAEQELAALKSEYSALIDYIDSLGPIETPVQLTPREIIEIKLQELAALKIRRENIPVLCEGCDANGGEQLQDELVKTKMELAAASHRGCQQIPPPVPTVATPNDAFPVPVAPREAMEDAAPKTPPVASRLAGKNDHGDPGRGKYRPDGDGKAAEPAGVILYCPACNEPVQSNHQCKERDEE